MMYRGESEPVDSRYITFGALCMRTPIQSQEGGQLASSFDMCSEHMPHDIMIATGRRCSQTTSL